MANSHNNNTATVVWHIDHKDTDGKRYADPREHANTPEETRHAQIDAVLSRYDVNPKASGEGTYWAWSEADGRDVQLTAADCAESLIEAETEVYGDREDGVPAPSQYSAQIVIGDNDDVRVTVDDYEAGRIYEDAADLPKDGTAREFLRFSLDVESLLNHAAEAVDEHVDEVRQEQKDEEVARLSEEYGNIVVTDEEAAQLAREAAIDPLDAPEAEEAAQLAREAAIDLAEGYAA